ncbi:hypothetical protein H5410_028338 [Solanum commersonii]|uniref:Putative plant transposon protein domain-containing protein n=1 Tax=Solanum commersonii TaxID=4109 RepID=A0A9J5Z773_SOLCO|nr:hypothetical protein H5410_028338 [Solanum commersonii]
MYGSFVGFVGRIGRVTLSGAQRSGKKVATFSQRKRVWSGGNVPPAPTVPKGQTKRFRGQLGSGVPTDIEADQGVTYEVYLCRARRVKLAHGTLQDTDPLVLTGLNIRPPYRAIRHTLCGPQSMVQWTKHSGKRYHQSFPYAHMLRKAQVWLKIIVHYLIPGLHHTNITRDWICLVYVLMTATKVNIGVVFKSAMQNARVHKGHRYAFGSLITRMCRAAGVPKDNVDYMALLFAAPMDITRTKGPDIEFGPTLTTAEHHRRDELIMARMYGLEMLRHQNGCLASTDMQLGDVERRYPLNAHAKALLRIGPEFREPIDDDIPIVEERLRTSSDVEFDYDEDVDPAQAGDEVEWGDAMEN